MKEGHAAGIEWLRTAMPVDYAAAVAEMEARAQAIHDGSAAERVWLLEHPPLYTAGTSARPQDLLAPARFPVHATGRGGQFTYHGPGQRVAYVQLDLNRRGRDIRAYVCQLEGWIIAALARLGVRGERRGGRVGIWVDTPRGEAKIAALGVRVRRWVTLHGISINVAPDLDHFSGIVPCGLADYGVTSLADLGFDSDMSAVDDALAACFGDAFPIPADAAGEPAAGAPALDRAS